MERIERVVPQVGGMDTKKGKGRICYILHSQGVDGASLSLLYLIRELDRERYDPVAIFLAGSEMCDTFRRYGIEIMVARGMTYFSHTTGGHIHLGSPRSLIQILMFLPSVVYTWWVVRRFKPVLVHVNSATLLPQVIGAKLAGARVVWHVREHILDGHLGLRKHLHTWVGRYFADAIISILKSEVDRLGCPEKTQVIYNFVDFGIFDRRLRDENRTTRQGELKTVTMLGNVSAIKGALEFVKAYPLVRDKLGPVRFLIVGNDGKSQAADEWLGLSGRLKRFLGKHNYPREVHAYVNEHCNGRDGEVGGVVFTGVMDDIPHVLANTDLLVFPSTVPHFSRPIIEAGAMAIPVIASDLEGPRELVVHGQTGLLVPPANPEALAEAIVAVLSDEARARSLGECGYAQARRLFDARVNSEATFAIYERLLERDGMTQSGSPGDTTTNGAGQGGPQSVSVQLPWAIAFLVWLVVVFSAYFFNLMTVPGRLNKLLQLLQYILP